MVDLRALRTAKLGSQDWPGRRDTRASSSIHASSARFSCREIAAWAREAGLVCKHDGLHPVSKVELSQDLPDVSLDGRLRHEQRRRDLGVRETAPDETQ